MENQQPRLLRGALIATYLLTYLCIAYLRCSLPVMAFAVFVVLV